MDNIRPIVPAGDPDRTAVLWLRGTYTNYHDYDLDVVGIVTATGPPLTTAARLAVSGTAASPPDKGDIVAATWPSSLK